MPTFKRGYIWRVGNGENINIYSDPWIPSSIDRKILSPRGDGTFSKVADLIDPSTGTWNIARLSDLFLVVDVNRILEIPLNNQGFDDFIAWNYTNHGQYTVYLGITFNGDINSGQELLSSPFQEFQLLTLFGKLYGS
jgi:hypothetical protein